MTLRLTLQLHSHSTLELHCATYLWSLMMTALDGFGLHSTSQYKELRVQVSATGKASKRALFWTELLSS